MDFRRLILLGVLVGGCGDDDSGDDRTTVAEDSSGTTMTATTSMTTSATATASSSASTTTSESDTDADTTDVTSGSDDTVTTTTSATDTEGTEADSGTGHVTDCAGFPCGGDEVCVIPCCGGPAPGCDDTNQQGTCDNGMEPQPADQCGAGCSTVMCCPMTPCMAEPPYCAPKSDLSCAATSCSLDSCFGSLDDATLSCECA